MYDSTSGNTYATVQFKSYLWLMGDVENDSYTAKAKCYNDSTENCEKYGKLYMANLAYRACPEGFELPTESDWNDLISYRNSLSGDKKFSLNATMAGFCGYDENGRDFCGNKDKQSLFLTANNSVFVTSDGKSGTFKEAKSDFYYSLRCVARTYIVKSVKNLPTCDSSSQRTLEEFYVTDEKSNFRCNGSYKWVDNFNNYCYHVVEGLSNVVDDTTYICKNDRWTIAEWSDVSHKDCSSENEGETVLFNTHKHLCEDFSWRPYSIQEQEMGLCTGERYEEIDSIGSESYYCDTYGWRTAEFSDFAGNCNEGNLYEYMPYKGDYYGCSENGWVKLTEREIYLGLCGKENVGDLEKRGDTVFYCCDTLAWRFASLEEMVGQCTAARTGETTLYEQITYTNYEYVCDNETWRKKTNLEAVINRLCYSKNFGEVIQRNTGLHYICDPDSSDWRYATEEETYGVCDESKLYQIVNHNNRLKYCNGKNWVVVSHIESQEGLCTKDLYGAIARCNYDSKYYFCDTAGWRIAVEDDYLGTCNASNEGEIKMHAQKEHEYICEDSEWRYCKDEDILGECTASRNNEVVQVGRLYYACNSGRWEQVQPIIGEIGVCTSARKGEKATYDGYSLVCENKWHLDGDLELIFGTCDERNNGTQKFGIDQSTYTCKNNKWSLP